MKWFSKKIFFDRFNGECSNARVSFMDEAGMTAKGFKRYDEKARRDCLKKHRATL
jgi:hypothetical protein